MSYSSLIVCFSFNLTFKTKNFTNLQNSPNQPLLSSFIADIQAPKDSFKHLRAQTLKFTSKNQNPEQYRIFISQLRRWKSNNFKQTPVNANQKSFQSQSNFSSLDSRSQKRIEKILKIESSKWFLFCDFVTFWLDYYFRFAYPLVLMLYLVYMFILLTENQVVIFTTLAIEILMVLGIVIVLVFSWCVKFRKRVKEGK